MPFKIRFNMKPPTSLFDEVKQIAAETDDFLVGMRSLAPSRAVEVRERLSDLGIAEQDVPAAIEWARENPQG